MIFKAGDRVCHKSFGIGTIIDFRNDEIPTVEFDVRQPIFHDGRGHGSKAGKDGHCYWVHLDSLTLLSEGQNKPIIKSSIMKVTNLVKRLLDADTQTLVEAGYINGDLQLTEEGQSELLSLFFVDKKDALVALAKEKLAKDATK